MTFLLCIGPIQIHLPLPMKQLAWLLPVKAIEGKGESIGTSGSQSLLSQHPFIHTTLHLPIVSEETVAGIE